MIQKFLIYTRRGSRDVIILNNKWMGPNYTNFIYLWCVLIFRNKQEYVEIIARKTKTIINIWLLIISSNDYDVIIPIFMVLA